MATPPRITDTERDAAIARIIDRHDRIDDPRRSELSSEPDEVIAFVLDRGPAGVPRWVQAADHHDAVLLSTWCWWTERRRERQLLRRGLHLGLSATELGAPLGIRSRQGLRDRLDRLDALLTHDRPDEQLTRTARRVRRERDASQEWIDQHRDEIRCAISALQLQSGRVFTELPDLEGSEDPALSSTDVEEWAEELAQDYEDDALTPGTLAVAGLLAAAIRTHPRVLALDRRHRLHSALAVVEALRTSFAAGTSSRQDRSD